MNGWNDVLEAAPAAEAVPGRVVVLSAHPDDDVIALGRWLAGLRDVRFVVATDGAASHPGSTAIDPQTLARLRPQEHAAALAELGHVDADVCHLGLPDGRLADHEDVVVAALTDLVGADTLLVAPYRHDGHLDHEAAGRAAATATAHGGRLWEYPVWTWVWSTPSAHDATRLRRIEPAVDAVTKARALARYRTQVAPVGNAEPVVTADLLRHALHAPEVVLT